MHPRLIEKLAPDRTADLMAAAYRVQANIGNDDAPDRPLAARASGYELAPARWIQALRRGMGLALIRLGSRVSGLEGGEALRGASS